MAKNSQRWHEVISESPQFECSSASLGIQDRDLMYSKLWITVWRIRSMQKFHSKMTPSSLCTKFPLTETTYAKVCIIVFWTIIQLENSRVWMDMPGQ